MVDNELRPIHGVTLTAFYPSQHHDYAPIRTARPDSTLMSIKVRIDPTAPVSRLRAMSTHVTNLTMADPLIRAWHRLIRAIEGPADRSLPEAPLRFAEIACSWPLSTPGGASQTDALSRQDDAVQQAMMYIERNLYRQVALEQVADLVGLSPRHLTRRFRQACQMSPGQFADARRYERARDMLERSELSVKELAMRLGFASTASFSHWFHRRAGVTASTYRKFPRPERN